MEFRYDINGLRALAVIAVVLFHFGVGQVGGGFAGVDIFFVISGFLMTGIAMRKVASGWHGVLEFYLARARRIIPALWVMCALILGLGWFGLPPSFYESAGKQVAAALAFVSNIYFWRVGSYFGEDTETLWLLHTWSLSVEWQFYLVYPLLIWLVCRWLGRARLAPCLWAATLCSAWLCLYLAPWKQSAAFYLLPTRAWEMLAGGLVFIHRDSIRLSARTCGHLQRAGLAGLVASVVLMGGVAWPSWATALPVLATCAVLLANQQETRLLSNPLMQVTGRWSYSIYLWHWPLLVAMRYLELDTSPWALATGILLSWVLGGLSYRYVEVAGRQWLAGLSMRKSVLNFGLALGAVMSVGLVVWRAGGLDWRVSDEVRMADAGALLIDARRDQCLADKSHGKILPRCTFGSGEGIAAVVWGDSHAQSVVSAVGEALAGQGKVMFYGLSGCTAAALHVPAAVTEGCADFNARVVMEMKGVPATTPLIIVNRLVAYAPRPENGTRPLLEPMRHWLGLSSDRGARADNYFKDLGTLLCSMAAQRPVYVLRPIPAMASDVPRTAAMRSLLSHTPSDVTVMRADYERSSQRVNQFLDELPQACGVQVIDPAHALCDSSRCYGSRGHDTYYFDKHHLNERGNKLLIPVFRTIQPPATPPGQLAAVTGIR